MEISDKANEIRTHLLLKTASEVERFKKLDMKINSISPQNLYNLYSNIEICIENRIFSTTQRKSSSSLINEENNYEYENEYSPIYEPGIQLNKVLVSSKKNKTFYDKMEKENFSKNLRCSLDTNDTSVSSNPKKLSINLDNNLNKNEDSIQILRKFAKNLIHRRRKKKKAKSFYQNPYYKSQGNLTNLERNPLKHFSANSNKKFTNKSSKDVINENLEESIVENSPVIYSSGLFCPCDHKGVSCNKNNSFISCNSLLFKNKVSNISYNNNKDSNKKNLLMNIPYEYEELVVKKINKSKQIPQID